MKHPNLLSRTLPAALACAALIPLAGCSGNGGSSASSGGAGTSTLVLDAAASEVAVEARVDVVALQRPDGSFTTNLAPTGGRLVLASPRGASTGLPLRQAPAGTFTAVRFLLASGSVVATLTDGSREAVDVPGLELTAPFIDGAATLAGARWLAVSPVGATQPVRDAGGRLTWSPRLTASATGAHTVDQVAFTVTAVQLAAATVDGTLDDHGGLRLRAEIGERCELTDDSGRRGRDDFLRDLRPDDHLEVCGIMTDADRLVVSCAHRRGRGRPENEVYGRIIDIDAPAQAFTLQVQEIERGAGSLVVDPRPKLRVLAGGARIHRSGFRHIHLDFAALAVDMRVEVEWRGPVVERTVTADEVEIEDEPGHRGEIEGAVGEVRVDQGLLVVVPRGDDPLIVAGRSVPSADVVILPNTVIFGPDNAGRHVLQLGEVQPGQRVWIYGRVVEERRVEALTVRVRRDNRR